MSDDADVSRSVEPSTSRSKARPKVSATISLVLGIIVAIVAIASLASASTDGALLGVGLLAVAIPVIAFLLARYGFRLARPVPGKEPRVGLLMLLVALAFFGVIGSMGAFVISSAATSQNGAGTAIILLLLSGTVTVAGARVMGIAAVRSRARVLS